MEKHQNDITNNDYKTTFSFEEKKYNREYILLQFRISFNRELYDNNIISFQTFTDLNNYLYDLSNKELRKQAIKNERKNTNKLAR